MILSINGRMLIAACMVLVGFLGITGATLESSFQRSVYEAMKERLRAHLTAIIASADTNENGVLELVHALPETRFFTEGSGLYAKILGNDGEIQWASPSMKGLTLPIYVALKRGDEIYERLYASDGTPVLSYSLGVTWGGDEKFKEGYTFVVAESLERVNQQVMEFRHNLSAWLGGVTIVLLIVLTLILRWGLTPLRRVAEDLREIEQGRHLELEGRYPKELRGLTDNLNALIRTNQERESRYQASLGDLAHSLKTPLAVLRGVVETSEQQESMRATVEEQVERMDQIVQYQLQRAATSGRTTLVAPVDLGGLVEKIMSAMSKVYADREVVGEWYIQSNLEFHCEEGDLMELLGNLIDNAFKWASAKVVVDVSRQKGGTEEKPDSLVMLISDDGPGIAEDQISTVLERGVRLDSEISGHGIGLAMVCNIVDLYEGELSFMRSDAGGALVKVVLPWH